MRKIEIELRVADRDDLEGMRRKYNDYRSERALAVLHCALGKSARQIGILLQRTEKTVRSWLNSYHLHGVSGLSRTYSPGRPNLRSLKFAPRMEEYLSKTPEDYGWGEGVWSIKVLIAQYEKETGLKISEDRLSINISGERFEYSFDKSSAKISSVKVDGKELIKRGAELNVWRAPLANESDEWNYNWTAGRNNTEGYGHTAATDWYNAGIDKLKTIPEFIKILNSDDQTITIEARDVVQTATGWGAFLNHYIYIINSKGELTIDHTVIPNGIMPSWLPRVGLSWILDRSLDNIKWYGRGPQENYPDRKSGYKTGVYNSKVADMYEPYLIPQDYGLRTDSRWVRLTDDSGTGIEFSGEKPFNFSAQTFSVDNLTKALYTYQLHPFDGITFNFDYATSGLGCTALSVFPEYQVRPQRFDFRTKLRPVLP